MELTDVYTKVDAQINAYRRACKYYETGRPTQYFLANRVSKTDFIKSLATKNGETVMESQSILQKCRRFYQELYTQEQIELSLEFIVKEQRFLSNLPTDKISKEMKNELAKQIMKQELYNALSRLKLDKSPGLDSLTVEFYQAFWPQIEDLVYNSLMSALDRGELSISQRKGILRLIPKKDKNPLWVTNWRPISLLNVDYKLLTKALAL